jgi:hypothetical protein
MNDPYLDLINEQWSKIAMIYQNARNTPSFRWGM